MQYLNNSFNAELCFKKAVCVIVSFYAAFGLNTWHKIFMFFLALQGESLELENVLSDFIMCRLFY